MGLNLWPHAQLPSFPVYFYTCALLKKCHDPLEDIIQALDLK